MKGGETRAPRPYGELPTSPSCASGRHHLGPARPHTVTAQSAYSASLCSPPSMPPPMLPLLNDGDRRCGRSRNCGSRRWSRLRSAHASGVITLPSGATVPPRCGRNAPQSARGPLSTRSALPGQRHHLVVSAATQSSRAFGKASEWSPIKAARSSFRARQQVSCAAARREFGCPQQLPRDRARAAGVAVATSGSSPALSTTRRNG